MIDKDLSKALTKKIWCLKSKNAQVKIGTDTVACTVFMKVVCEARAKVNRGKALWG